MIMGILQSKLCDIQGRLFEMSADKEYDSVTFIKQFMNSNLAHNLDSEYNRMQWAGEEYLMEELADECAQLLTHHGTLFTKDELFWMGYIYRYWHFYTGEDSRKIYKQAPVETMKINYYMFHTMSPEMAIDDLKEIYKQKKS